jgi:transcriptional regulator with XRE-family HTH domain
MRGLFIMDSITGDAAIGERIKAARNERGITQEVLAERAKVSRDTIAKLEQGQRENARMTTLSAIANALGITRSALLGSRERLERPEGILAVRDALLSLADLPGIDMAADDGEPTPLADLEAAVRDGWALYWDGQLAGLAGMLPGLIGEARITRAGLGPSASGPLTQAYQLAADLCVHVGSDDLAMVAAERALAAAAAGDDELQHATLFGTVSWVLLHQARTAEAEMVARLAAERIEPRMSAATPQHLTVWGALLLSAAAPAATAAKADDVAGYIGLARSAAGRFEADRHDYWVSFGPTQVAMQDTYTSAVLGQSARALKAARGVRRENLLHISYGAHKLDVAQALIDSRRGGEAVGALLEAQAVSAEWFRHQGLARNLVRDLVARQKRLTPALRQLAGSIGVN